MTQKEFYETFDAWWKEEYPLERKPAKDALHAADDLIQHSTDMVRLRMFLVAYARQLKDCEISRNKGNRAMRIFEKMGVDPKAIDFED
jgi:hypothetical protein